MMNFIIERISWRIVLITDTIVSAKDQYKIGHSSKKLLNLIFNVEYYASYKMQKLFSTEHFYTTITITNTTITIICHQCCGAGAEIKFCGSATQRTYTYITRTGLFLSYKRLNSIRFVKTEDYIFRKKTESRCTPEQRLL
jgi:hypothetical protein